ncbi:UvrD-helicase domain-containing protein [Myxococcota bacterium]|nr:UvrD-helicase domain-containing protein [Myxococcota bacterium]
MSTPRDLDVRSRAIRALDTSMALEAGAGSGKTSVLVERIVGLLGSGRVAPRQLAAITFTEKAAGELAERVRDALEGSLARAATTDERDRLGRVLDDFGELTLSTIHGFCRGLLLAESLEAGFAPDTEIGDDAAARAHTEAALAEWSRALKKEHPRLARLAEGLVRPSALVRAVSKLQQYRAYADVVAAEELDVARMKLELADVRAEIEEVQKICADPTSCKLIANNHALVAAVRAATWGKPAAVEEALLALVVSNLRSKAVGGTQRHWGADGKPRYLAALGRVDEWRARWRTIAHGALLRSLRAHVLPRLEMKKRDVSLATFDDLLLDAARLLREAPSARRRLSERWAVVLVDEVQDTDPVQAEVAALLTSPPVSGPWHDAVIEPGRLFAVGDPKQSIYRFRGADVDTFGRIRGAIAKSGETASLVENFRSVPGIVAWVNHVFAELPGYTPQHAHRGPAELDPVVLLEPGEGDDADEIDAVLRHLGSLFSSGARVVDRESREPRPLRPSDVMVLLPAWRRADETADRFRAAGLECVVEGGDTFFQRDEVRLSVSLLRALVEPADAEATALVLRGLFGLSHVELADHVARGGRLRHDVPSPPPGPVADALAILSEAHRRRGSRSLAALVSTVLAKTRVRAVWRLLPDGLSRLANVDKLLAMVRELEADATSPFAAVEALARRARSARAQEKDIDRLDKDGDAVRITSLFKAKGLEAPVVVLMHASRKPGVVDGVVDHEARRVAVKLGDLTPPDWSALSEREKAQAAEERRRWMYVAATRARDQLVLSRTNDRDTLHVPDLAPRGLPAESLGHDVVHAIEGAEVRVRQAAALAEVEPTREAFPGLDAVLAPLLAGPATTPDHDGEARVHEVARGLRDAKLACVRWRAASDAEGALRWSPGVPGDGDPLAGGGARAGRVVHAVMERLDLSRPRAELEAEAAELAPILARHAGLDAPVAAACLDVVRKILAHPLVDEARAAPERWQEAPFTYAVSGRSIVAGTIDLCFPIDPARKRWVVVDYKANVPAAGSALFVHYRDQLAKYAKALLASLGDVEIVKTVLVGPHAELGPVTTDDVLLDVPPELRDALAALVAAGVPRPELDLDIGERVTLSADVAWAKERVAFVRALTPDARVALEAEGWRLVDDLGAVPALFVDALPEAEDG